MRAERRRGSQACIPAFSRFWSSRSCVQNRCSQGMSLRSFSFEMAAFLHKCVSDTAFEGSGDLPLDVLDKLEANHLRSFSARSPLVLRSFSAPSPLISARSPLVLRSFSARSPAPPAPIHHLRPHLRHPTSTFVRIVHKIHFMIFYFQYLRKRRRFRSTLGFETSPANTCFVHRTCCSRIG